jgi:hexokinase
MAIGVVFDTGCPQNVPAELTALINDTTGTLIASSYVNPRTRIAVIFGTGCNAAYMERVGEIHKIKNLGIDDDAHMAINCEWVCCSSCGRRMRRSLFPIPSQGRV